MSHGFGYFSAHWCFIWKENLWQNYLAKNNDWETYLHEDVLATYWQTQSQKLTMPLGFQIFIKVVNSLKDKVNFVLDEMGRTP